MQAQNLTYRIPFMHGYKEINLVHTELTNRHEATNEYRYGYNGMEKDDEIHNVEGSSYDFWSRIYDCRVGRWLSLDLIATEYPNQSTYNYVVNSPIMTNSNNNPNASEKKRTYSLFQMLKWNKNSGKNIDK